MNKIKEFFSQKWVRITGWALAILGDITLILGGTTIAEITDGAKLTLGIISAIGLLIAFLAEKIKKQSKE